VSHESAFLQDIGEHPDEHSLGEALLARYGEKASDFVSADDLPRWSGWHWQPDQRGEGI
jgi:hypothetical protein